MNYLIQKLKKKYFKINTKTFLLWVGVLFVIHGLRGLFDPTVFPGPDLDLYFLPMANYTYILFGIIGVIASMQANHKLRILVTLVLGLTGFLIAATKFLVIGVPEFSYSGLIEIEFFDVLIHFGTGIWALLALWSKK